MPAPFYVREKHRFLAEGVQLLLNLADPIEHVTTDGEPVTVRRSCIYGPMTAPVQIRMLGRIEVLGVCFRVGRAYPFIPYPVGQLVNGHAETEHIWDAAGMEIVDRIRTDYHTMEERIHMLDLHFLSKLEKGARKVSSTAAAADLIETHKGQVNIGHLARSVGLSSRQLERCFKERVGMSPKQLCRIVRFKNVFPYLAASRNGCLASTAVNCGYYDQSHMIRDFKQYTGTSPADFFTKPQATDRLFTGNF